MYKHLNIKNLDVTAEYRPQPYANYLIGGFIKYYTDKHHPEYESGGAPPIKELKIRIDAFKRIVEVSFTNARRKRAK